MSNDPYHKHQNCILLRQTQLKNGEFYTSSTYSLRTCQSDSFPHFHHAISNYEKFKFKDEFHCYNSSFFKFDTLPFKIKIFLTYIWIIVNDHSNNFSSYIVIKHQIISNIYSQNIDPITPTHYQLQTDNKEMVL